MLLAPCTPLRVPTSALVCVFFLIIVVEQVWKWSGEIVYCMYDWQIPVPVAERSKA